MINITFAGMPRKSRGGSGLARVSKATGAYAKRKQRENDDCRELEYNTEIIMPSFVI